MKHNISLLSLLCVAACMTLAGCDKIEADEYGRHVIFSGASGAWQDGPAVTDHATRVLLEKYTGVRCTNCPYADVVIATAKEKYGSSLIPVAIHDSSVFAKPYNGYPDLRTEDGNTWSKFFGIYSYPSALINRTKQGDRIFILNPTAQMNPTIDDALEATSPVALEVQAQLSDSGLSVTANLEYLRQEDGALTLTLLLMEDSIVTKQSMPDATTQEGYVQNHVLRDVITDVWGLDVDADGQAGTRRTTTVTYRDMKAEWVPRSCHVVAFVSYKDSRVIANVAECGITGAL